MKTKHQKTISKGTFSKFELVFFFFAYFQTNYYKICIYENKTSKNSKQTHIF